MMNIKTLGIKLKTDMSKLRKLLLLVIVAFISLNSSGVLAAVSTTLYSQDFSEGYVPPKGWDSYYYYYDNGNGYTWSYWSKAGANDYDGSWVINLYDCNQDYIHSPQVDASAFTGPSDKIFVEFDAWIEYDGYDFDQSNNSKTGESGAYFAVYADDGSGNYSQNAPLLEYTHTDDVFTFDNRSDYSFNYRDPIPGKGFWRHYKLLVPTEQRYSSLDFYFIAYANWNCNGGNIAIDNFSISGESSQNISFSPSVLSFPSITVGSTTPSQCFTLTNESAADISLGSFTFGGLNPGDFILTSKTPSSIPAFSSIDICVAFKPTTYGSRYANIQIANSSDNAPLVTIDLNGIGLAPAIEILGLGLHNSATKLFSSALDKLGDTLEQKVSVHNSGNSPLTLSPSSNISGDYPNEYWISFLPTNPIGVDKYDTIRVKFRPIAEGTRGAKLNIISNAYNGTQVMDLRGTGILPRIVVKSNPLRFDSVAIGDNVCKTVTVYNPGSDTLKIVNQIISSGEGDFNMSLIPSELTAIPPDKSRDINICFKPRQAGTRQGRLTLLTNIPKTFEGVRRDTSSVDINMSGTCVPFGSLFIVSSNTGGLDSTIIGTQFCRVDTIFNSGSADLLVTSLTIAGTNANEFSYSGVTVPFVIKAKSSVNINVCGTPSIRGLRQAKLNITATSNEKPLATNLDLEVFGQLVCATTAPNALFVDQKIIKNTDSTMCVTVTNCGDVVADYTPQLTNQTGYSVSPAIVSGVAPGMTAEFCVKFSPSAIGMVTGKLNITSPNLPTQVVDLGGVGACAQLTSDAPVIPDVNAGGHNTFILTLTNSGNLDWNPGTPVITPANSAYSFAGTVPVVPAGGNAQVIFKYDPTEINTLYAAQITFPNAGPCTESPLSVNVSKQTGSLGVSQLTEKNGFSLEQNYPNPTVGATSFNFTLPTEAIVNLTVNDLSGREIKQIISGRISAGLHSVNFDASNLASGTYVYTLESNGVRLSRYLVLSK